MVLSERLLKDSLTRAEREDSSTENVIMSLTALPPAWDLRCTSVRHQDHASRLPNSGRRTGLCNCLNIEVIARGQEELSRQDAKSSAQLWDLARTEEHQAEAVDKLAWYFLNCLPCCLLQVFCCMGSAEQFDDGGAQSPEVSPGVKRERVNQETKLTHSMWLKLLREAAREAHYRLLRHHFVFSTRVRLSLISAFVVFCVGVYSLYAPRLGIESSSTVLYIRVVQLAVIGMKVLAGRLPILASCGMFCLNRCYCLRSICT